MEIPFQLSAKNVSDFEVVDPFNEQNTLKGYICKTPDHKYGMLFITHVNGDSEPQIVWAVPKIRYPFTREGGWRFPKAESVKVYEKLDGTSILAYRYTHKGETFVTYKTRLRPVLGASKYGNFVSLWGEMLEKYPTIKELPIINNCNIAFEMYGTKNKILIDYHVLLDTRILFGVFDDGSLVSPDVLDGSGVPHTDLIEEIDGETDLIEAYARVKAFLDEHIKVTKDEKMERELVEGMEGSVWYVIAKDGVIQYKCKPQYVQDIHFAAGGIPRHSIYITCVNAFEDVEHLTFDKIKSMLLEEYPEDAIYKKKMTIENIMRDVEFHMKLKAKILEDYREKGWHHTINFVENKGMIMRYFAENYDKKLAGQIFRILNENFGAV